MLATFIRRFSTALLTKKIVQKVILILIVSTPALASFPENDFGQGDDPSKYWNISRQDFWDIQQFVYDIYKPVFDGLKVDGQIVAWWFEGNWESKTNNMYAKKEKVPPYNWNKWTIQVHGGLARRVQMTKEGFILGLCHEIGHLVGGYPTMDYTQYSTEGESDYYATHVCARKVFKEWAKKYPLKKLGLTVDVCEKYFDTPEEKDICIYSVFAAKSLSELLYVLNREIRTPDIELTDAHKVKLTYQLHTPSQCRLDTYMAGILCDKVWDDKVIPTNKNAVCRNRPACWYAPK